jgi:hypothetical protein
MSGTIVFVAFYTQCAPLAMVWNPTVKGKCYINITILGIVNAAYTTFIDFFLAGMIKYKAVYTL